MNSMVTQCSAAEKAGGDLVLRVCGSTRHGQIVRLRSPKCTVGSGPRCTLRLRARGVRPIHCLIVRGSGATVIRRWSSDTRLNGRTFTDAELVGGDRLGIGNIELEVLDPGRLPTPDPTQSRQPQTQTPPSPQPPVPGGSDRGTIEKMTARLTLANRQGRQRVRRLLEKLRSADGELARLGKLQAELTEIQRQLDERAEAVNGRSNDLDLQREEFEREHCGLKAKLTEAEGQLRRRVEQFDADRAELEAQREEFQLCRQRWEAERQATELQQAEPAAESEQLQQPEVQDPTEQVPPQAASEEPVDISDVFRRMGSRESLSGDKPVQESSAEPEPHQPPDSAAADESAEPSRPREEGGEEESITDYMSRLMDRVHAIRGDDKREDHRQEEPQPEAPVESASPPQPPVEPASPPQTPGESASQPPRPVEPALQDADEAPAPDELSTPQPARPFGGTRSCPTDGRPRQPAEMAPRVVAPEKQIDLSAMRDLANLTAHSAIDHHAQQQARHASWGKLLIVAVAIGAGIGLLWIWRTTGSGNSTFYAAMVSFLVAMLWILKCTGLAGRKMPGKFGRLGKKPDRNRQSKLGKTASQQQGASCGGESGVPLDESARELEHELKALIDAWPEE